MLDPDLYSNSSESASPMTTIPISKVPYLLLQGSGTPCKNLQMWIVKLDERGNNASGLNFITLRIQS